MKAFALTLFALLLVHRVISQPSKPQMVGEGADWFSYHRDGGGV